MGGDLRSLKRLVGEAADINCVVDDLGCSALVLSCYFTHYECAKYLLSMGADFELADNEGVTPLIAAARDGGDQPKIVKMLVEKGSTTREAVHCS